MENKKPANRPEPKPEATSQKTPSQPKKSNTALIIILVIVFGLVVLGIGGYFGWRYLAKKLSQKSTTTTTNTNTNVNTNSNNANSNNSNSANANSNNTNKTTSSDYIIADSNTRLISRSELISLTPWQLKVARNEIYARHGRAFVHKDLQCYFAKKSWYKSDVNFSENLLGNTENQNVATILSYEREINSPPLATDSGCNTN